jgi:hypothetical protein
LDLDQLVFAVEDGRDVLVDVLVHAENGNSEVVVLDQQVVGRLADTIGQ